jgi:hypothetical protein
MLIGSLWGDAMGREMRDEAKLWVTETNAARRYVQVFLRALGVMPPAARDLAGTGTLTHSTSS